MPELLLDVVLCAAGCEEEELENLVDEVQKLLV